MQLPPLFLTLITFNAIYSANAGEINPLTIMIKQDVVAGIQAKENFQALRETNPPKAKRLENVHKKLETENPKLTQEDLETIPELQKFELTSFIGGWHREYTRVNEEASFASSALFNDCYIDNDPYYTDNLFDSRNKQKQIKHDFCLLVQNTPLADLDISKKQFILECDLAQLGPAIEQINQNREYLLNAPAGASIKGTKK